MTAVLSRAVMKLAACCLGDRRSEWALAMQAEFEAALEDGQPLTFAFGCLVGALREMPAHDEGRFAIANYVLVIGLILPVSAIMLTGIILELPFLHFGQFDEHRLPGGGERGPLLTDANRTAVPSLAILVLLIIAAQLRIAWALLDCDWRRVGDTGRLIAASTVTLAIFNGLVFVSDTGLLHAAVVAVELTGILVLARWRDQLPSKAS